MGDSHFRSNILEQGDDALKIKFTNASFTNMTVTNISGDPTQSITTLTSNSVTATDLTISASTGFNYTPSLTATALAAPIKRLVRIDVGASTFYLKAYAKT